MDSRVRVSPEQLAILLEYMETHGDLARPVAGAQGRIRSDRLWSDLANILNSVGFGVNKTTEKWKKVWADWKSKTKKKGLAIRRHSGGTGGGPASRKTLSAVEERLLLVMGALSVEGQASVEELGFTRSQSPARDHLLNIDDMVHMEIIDVTSQLPSPPTPEPSTSHPSNPSSTSQVQTPPPRPLIRAPHSSQERQPAAPSPAAPPSPTAPGAPAPPAPAPTTPKRRRPAVPRAFATPPAARRRPRPRSPATPQSAGSPGRPRARAIRRRQAPTPFERAASEFTGVKLRRLEMEETRTRLQHERDMRALEIEHERNEVFMALVNVARDWLDYYRSRDNTEPLNVE